MNSSQSKQSPYHSVGIIGCGWLGKALAVTLQSKGIALLATTNQLANVSLLQQQGISAQQLSLPSNAATLSAQPIFSQQCLVIAITPQFKQGRFDYDQKIAQLVAAAEQRGVVQRIILLSSTGIYQGQVGNVDEHCQLSLPTQKTQTLYNAEQAVSNFSKLSNVIRLAGLVGPERHPGKFLLAKKVLSNAQSLTNLIHQHDAVGLILALLSQQAPPGIFNGVSDTHVSKKCYYQAAADALALKAPVFAQTNSNEAARIVCGDKAQHILGYKFIYPDLLAWL